jgi:RES domain-containing protein
MRSTQALYFEVMRLYRIMSEKRSSDPYSAATRGRWNPLNSLLIYAANRGSLAMLEYLTIRGPSVSGAVWKMVVYEIMDISLVGELLKDDLPDQWNLVPHPSTTQDFGMQWLRQNEFPVLKVPSVRLPIENYPEECNVLINPATANLKKMLKVVGVYDFKYLLNDWREVN